MIGPGLLDGRQGAGTVAALGGAAVGAFALLAWWASEPSGRYLDHTPGGDHPTGAVMALTFVVAWLLMSVASMLPAAIPLVVSFRTMIAGRAAGAALVAILVWAFLTVWTLAGIAMAGADLVVHALVDRTTLGAHTWVIAVGALGVAGAYQLSPLAMRCLHACRSPRGFLSRHWSGAPDVWRQSYAIGLDYGLSCLGCCAGLMFVMFAVGMTHPWWMVALGAVTGAQRLAPFGRGLATATGVLLLGVALSMVVLHASAVG